MNNFIVKTVRSAAILTDAYVAGTVLDGADDFNNLEILAKWTKGSLTSLELKVEFSDDGTVYYGEVEAAANTAGVITPVIVTRSTTVEGNYKISIPLKKTSYVKISAKGTGTMTGSSLAIKAVLGNI